MQIDTNGFEIGDVAKDTITGFEGTVVCMSQWTTGCARALLQPKVDKEGKVPESQGFDVLTMQMVKAGPRHEVERSKGGPRPAPTRAMDPRR